MPVTVCATAAMYSETPDPIEIVDHDASEAQPACGVCIAYHVIARLVVNVVWLMCLPLKVAESLLLGVLVVSASAVVQTDPVRVASGTAVGFFVAKGVLRPWASVDECSNFCAACTAYLCVVAWLVGQLAVNCAVALGKIDRARFVEYGCSSANCKYAFSLGPSGYLGLILGLLFEFGELAFRPSACSETGNEWSWCRASADMAAEPVYLAVLVLSMVTDFVSLPTK